MDMEISQNKYFAILKEKDKHEKMKENSRSEIEKQETVRLSSKKSRI